MADLSILIPARNEIFLERTTQDILANMRGDTEVIAVLDGSWPEQGIPDHPNVHLIHHSISIGQRAATNEAARLSSARYIMKADAHCAFDEGFDVKLLETFEHDWTVIPRMYNLHAFDWLCKNCGRRQYQGPKPETCENCKSQFEMDVVWKPRLNRRTDFARFDRDLHFQYWGDYEKRLQAKSDIADVMCCVGACWMMERSRYWELGGLDEAHGSWGQMGVEIACKSWLSGGRQVVNKKTWFAHMFRTQPGFGFPYPNPGIQKAREHSHRLWMGNTWSGAKHPFSWLIEKFAPVPEWDKAQQLRPGLIYYTDSRLEPGLANLVREQIKRGCNGHQVISVSLAPLDFGDFNIHVPYERGVLTMFKQILAGLEHSTADYVFLVEHDLLYHPSHFEFVPPRGDVFYYNTNVWKLRAADGHAIRTDFCQQTSGLCAHRTLLVEHYRKRVERVEREGYSRAMGFEPGTHSYPRGVDNYKAESWESPFPNIDIRHESNLTPSRWSPDEFRNPRYARGWQEANGELPGWGSVQDILKNIREAA